MYVCMYVCMYMWDIMARFSAEGMYVCMSMYVCMYVSVTLCRIWWRGSSSRHACLYAYMYVCMYHGPYVRYYGEVSTYGMYINIIHTHSMQTNFAEFPRELYEDWYNTHTYI